MIGRDRMKPMPAVKRVQAPVVSVSRRSAKRTEHETDQAGAVGQRAAAQRIERPAQHRAANGGHAHDHAVGGDGRGKALARYDLRQQAGQRRPGEGPRAAIKHQHAIVVDHRLAPHRQPQQRSGTRGFEQPAQRQDQLAVIAVDQITGRQQQEQHRHELRQADIGQRQRIAGDVVDLPGNDYRLDLHGKHGQQASGEKGGETGKTVDG